MDHSDRRQPFVMPPELRGGRTDAPVAIVGAGPVGLALAIDLALRGVASVVLDDNDVVSVGSRAICWAKRTLEIFDRLGIGARMRDKGVTWATGRVFHGADPVYAFDLLPEDGHRCPAFVNLQQYYVEQFLIDRARDFPDLIDLRFLNRVTAHRDTGDGVVLDVDTPAGAYALEVRYLVACDGASSPTRGRMGLRWEGQTFEEQFLIADIEMAESPFPGAGAERWFWFDPPFHPGKSALLHMQPDNIYRIDLQLSPGADARAEATEDRVTPRIRAIVGDRPFRLDWVSVYRFRCIRLDRFVHGRVIFCGDSAHVVSPFGARGGNGGVQDADNLGWKLAAVLAGHAGPGLLDSYDAERGMAADENILNSSRATHFMTPRTAVEALFRAEALRLARTEPFAQRLLNSGRLSVPCVLAGSALVTPGDAPLPPGSPARDAPVSGGWLLDHVQQGDFVLMGVGMDLPDVPGVRRLGVGLGAGYPVVTDDAGLVAARYGAGLAYLFRPDGHVAAVFRDPDAAAVLAARARALGHLRAHAPGHLTEDA